MKVILLSLLFFLSGQTEAVASKTHPKFLSRLAHAVEMDDISAVRRAIESNEATVDERVESPAGTDAIHPIIVVAARSGSEKVAKYLIEKNCDVNARNNSGETALMMASFFDDSLYGGSGDFSKHDRIAKMLIAAGASLENGDFWAPLAYAAYKNRTGIGQFLIEKGAKVDGPVHQGRSPVNTPLMMAVLNGHKAFTLLLLRNGADAKIINDKKNWTALDLAEKTNQTHLIPFLKCAEGLKPGEYFQDHCTRIQSSIENKCRAIFGFLHISFSQPGLEINLNEAELIKSRLSAFG